MIKRPIIAILASLILLLALANPLFAGGWVVVTLDELPRQVIAGETLELGFTVRQHGQTLINLSGAALEAHNPGTGETIEAPARPGGFTGHYWVKVRFPSAGLWRWQITPHPFTTVAAMPPLTVRSGTPPSIVDQPPANLLLFAVQMVQQWWTQTVSAAQPVQGANQEDLMLYGHDLFLAKGCTACHLHSAAPVDWSTQAGPDLSHYDKTAAFLRLWLADPAAIKPTTAMPSLDLDSAEIEALTAFLVQDGPAVKP